MLELSKTISRSFKAFKKPEIHVLEPLLSMFRGSRVFEGRNILSFLGVAFVCDVRASKNYQCPVKVLVKATNICLGVCEYEYSSLDFLFFLCAKLNSAVSHVCSFPYLPLFTFSTFLLLFFYLFPLFCLIYLSVLWFNFSFPCYHYPVLLPVPLSVCF